MSYHVGFLYFANQYGNAVEVFNEARTTYNMTTAINSGVKRYGDVLKNGGCESLNYVPCTMASTGSVTSWQTMTTGPTSNPWYSSSSAASTEAFGFWVEEWTGLDGAHHSRNVTPLGPARGGATFGRQTSGSRSMAISVFLVGSSERGLNHLFRWLESTLLACCDPTNNPSMWIREFCPTNSVSDITEGLARADGVALIGGLEWADPPAEDMGCFVRKATFTLGTESPCLYREPVTQASSTQLKSDFRTYTKDFLYTNAQPAHVAEFVGTSLRTAANLPVPAYGMVSPIVTITSGYQMTNGVRLFLPQLRILGFANPSNASADRPGSMVPVGCILVGDVPAGVTLVIDVGSGTVKYLDAARSVSYEPGDFFLSTSNANSAETDLSFSWPSFLPFGSKLPRWFGFSNCDIGCVAVEPNVVPQLAFLNSVFAASWTVTIESSTRFGCC